MNQFPTPSPEEIEEKLRGFTKNFVLFQIEDPVCYTEGVHYLVEHCDADWLLESIAIAQRLPSVAEELTQDWKVQRSEDGTAVTLTCKNWDGRVILTVEVSRAGFPLQEVSLSVCDRVVRLPSEE